MIINKRHCKLGYKRESKEFVGEKEPEGLVVGLDWGDYPKAVSKNEGKKPSRRK